jgi:hypothetical protein
LLPGLVRYLPGLGAQCGLWSNGGLRRFAVGTVSALEKESEHMMSIR